jgi:hypothetical protein
LRFNSAPLWRAATRVRHSQKLLTQRQNQKLGGGGDGGGGVGTLVAEAAFEFFAGAESANVSDAIDAEDAVEMIDFVLEELGEIGGVGGVELAGAAGAILIADFNFTMTLDLHEDGKKTETAIPDDDFLFAARGNDWIDERPGIGALKLKEDDAFVYADLRSGDGAAVAGGGTGEGQGIGEVGDDVADARGGGIGYGGCDLAKAGIAELEDFADGHNRRIVARNTGCDEGKRNGQGGCSP